MKHSTEEINLQNTTVRLKNNTLLQHKESNFVECCSVARLSVFSSLETAHLTFVLITLFSIDSAVIC